MRPCNVQRQEQVRARREYLIECVATRDRSVCWTDGDFPADRDGYPLLAKRKAGHVAMEADGRPRPAGQQQLHSCDNPPCWNPAHLRWGTAAENSADMVARGRSSSPRGENARGAKLTGVQVVAFRARRAAGEGVNALAREAGVTSSTMSYALRGKTWAS